MKRILLPLYLIAGSIFIWSSIPSSEDKGKDWNILLISIDTIRPDRLGCYNPKYLQTPHIDALAARGALFGRAMAHNPLTLPSHVNILLGTTPLHHGVHENSKSLLHASFYTLTEHLKEKEYATGAFIGAFPLDSRFGLAQGFDVYDESYPSGSPGVFLYPERNSTQVIGSAINWIAKQNSKWFSFVHLWDPHAPYLPPEPFNTKFRHDPYSGEVAYVDSELGKFLDYLEDRGRMEDTLIVLTGDHGEAFGEHGENSHGYFAYNSTLWIPLIVAGPGIKAGRTDEFVCHIDIYPTICDILGLDKPSFLQGVSLLPLMQGKKIKKRAIYFESLDAYYNRGWAPLRGIIEDRKKFIDSPLPEYYDLETDFLEQNDLIQDIDVAKYRRKMEGLMDELSSSNRIQHPQRTDRDTLEKLKSLGYISSPIAQVKESYGPEDDLKTLLPFQEKYLEAMDLVEKGKEAEGIKIFTDIIQSRKDFVKAYIYLSTVYEARGLREEARRIMENGYRENPEDYGITSSYGFLLLKQGELDEGIAVLEKALEIVDYDPDVWTNLGSAYNQRREYIKAMDCYGRAIALDSTDALIYNNLGFLHFSIFLQTRKKEDHDRAEESYRKAIELDPALVSAYNGLGGAFKAGGRVDEAIAAWEKAVELAPDFDFPIYNLGVAHLEKGNKTRALKYFERYLVLKEDELTPEERRKINAFIKKCKEGNQIYEQ